MKFGLPDGLTINTPKGYTVFTVDGNVFAYCKEGRIYESLLIVGVDLAGNALWRNTDHHLLTEAVIKHLEKGNCEVQP